VTRLSPPREVVEIAATLKRAGHEAWCVGGAVRDALLGYDHLDWDLATSATPAEVQKLFRRTIPVGIEFGTVGVLDRHRVMHEVTTFRKDVRTDGRHAVVEFGVSLDADLARRDFTINAIAYEPETGELRDPFDGRHDLKRGVVRAVGEPEARMREDRLRALRAIRFAARFGFHIEPTTWAAIRASASHLTRLSAERVKQELEKTMQQVRQPSVALEWWRECGALAALVPSLAAAPAERFRAVDLLPQAGASALEGDAAAQADPGGATLNRLAMLFFGDEPGDAERALKKLKFSNADAAWIVSLARARREVGPAVSGVLANRSATAPEIRRWVAAVGRTRTDAFCELNGALQLAATAAPDGKTGHRAVDVGLAARLEEFRRAAVEIAFRDPIETADLAVDGEDLKAVGIKPGPELGRVLRALLDLVIDDPARNERGVLLAEARRLAG
jgi:tRNA nucleotidyltransferase (CCA-adding enzyme)